MKPLIFGWAAAVLLVTATAPAVEPKAPDHEFFAKAAIAGMYEVKAGELGQKNGTGTSVRNFATMMVNDHSGANDKLKALAQKKGVILPPGPDASHQKMLDKLARHRPGKEFDEEFADQMEDSHDKAVKLFEKAAKNAKDPDVRAFAAATLPTLRNHSEMAEALDQKDVAP